MQYSQNCAKTSKFLETVVPMRAVIGQAAGLNGNWANDAVIAGDSRV
jgi:hypothetical protein